MFKKVVAAMTMGLVIASANAQSVGAFSPYQQPEANFIYNLLFCDDLKLFKNDDKSPPWKTVLDPHPSAAALRSIAEDESQESRVRVLAYNRLRELNEPVAPKKLLGVIVEVPLQGGLDVLAAFPDGRVRYINKTGKMTIVETPALEDVASSASKLLAASRPVVNKIGPWDKARLAPPTGSEVRLTFLVSDGLYFGQGPYEQFRRDAMAGPVLAAAEQLLQAVVNESLKKNPKAS